MARVIPCAPHESREGSGDGDRLGQLSQNPDPANVEAIQQLLGPLILLPLMFVVGLQLTPDDFRRVVQAPRAVVGGTLGQLVLLPLMTWGIVTLFGVSPFRASSRRRTKSVLSSTTAANSAAFERK